jgi:alkaline phosphatase D
VLHLGDFIYEVVNIRRGKTRYDRTIYEVARIPDGGKVGNFHIPLTVEGYRAVYKGYLTIPTCRTRARAGRSSASGTITNSPGRAGRASSRRRPPQPGQTVKVAANQAWFEYIPARGEAPSGSLADSGRRRSRTSNRSNGTRTAWLEPNNLPRSAA